ncbi:hypothetical protein FHI69_15790 [Janthinobacterium lividum]|uniref:Lipoprotein n=2 Tax=Janthinobacterium lividum TaxID=29581 RepID=A0A5C4NR88_9BURK|nr:hypothetical protein FHI69_15790 [Janthinobacterium lividum]
MRHAKIVFAFLSAIVLSACSTVAPPYTPSMDNIQTLKNSAASQAKVGVFAAQKNADAPLSMRGSSLASPYAKSYSVYVAEALKQELSMANKLAPDADIEISGTLLQNEFDASGFSTGTAMLEARFIVKKAGEVRYDQIKTASHEWPSSFAGAIALPRAMQEYTVVVQKLLAQLYQDKAFNNSLR